MAIVRFDPNREVDSLQSEVNRVFDVFFGNGGRGPSRRWVPAMDLFETEGELVLRADLPGVTREEVQIEIKDSVLTISGERRAESQEEAEGYLRVERSFGSFTRSLSLPRGVEADAVAAEFTDGVLEVRVPKPEERKPHRVEIGSRPVEGAATET
jgi:HSP20 family protein